MFKPAFLATGAATGWWAMFVFRTESEKVLMTACLIAVVVDLFTGIAASYKDGKGIKSERMRKGHLKIAGYFGLFLLGVAVAAVVKTQGITTNTSPIVMLVLGLIFVTEALSVVENVHVLTGINAKFLVRILKGIQNNDEK